jgi:hypothetical protein
LDARHYGLTLGALVLAAAADVLLGQRGVEGLAKLVMYVDVI